MLALVGLAFIIGRDLLAGEHVEPMPGADAAKPRRIARVARLDREAAGTEPSRNDSRGKVAPPDRLWPMLRLPVGLGVSVVLSVLTLVRADGASLASRPRATPVLATQRVEWPPSFAVGVGGRMWLSLGSPLRFGSDVRLEQRAASIVVTIPTRWRT